MNLTALTQSVLSKLGETFPNLLGAIAVVIIGWIVAMLLRVVTRRGLGAMRTNDRLLQVTGSKIDVERGVSLGVYYLALVFTVIAFFNVLNLTQAAGPLQSMADAVLSQLPNIIAAAVLALVGWLSAVAIRRIVILAFSKTSIDERLSKQAGVRPLSDTLGHVSYWLVLLFFLPAVLDALELYGLLEPVNLVVRQVLGILPDLAAAIVLALAGWLVARLVRDLVSNLVHAAGVDNLGQRVGLKDEKALSGLVGLLAYVFVLVPALIAALQALRLEAISAPATGMLETLMGAIPGLFGAALVLGIGLLLAQLVTRLVAGALTGMGFNELPGRLGLESLFTEEMPPAKLAGQVAWFFIVLFSAVEAGELMGLNELSRHLSTFIGFASQVLLGVVIIAVGLWVSRLAYTAMARAYPGDTPVWANVVRFAILAVVLTMGLRAMGIADEIVDRAFTLLLGAVAVAAAIAFGLGGREVASRQLEAWLERARGGN